jgi:hypothetical protein
MARFQPVDKFAEKKVIPPFSKEFHKASYKAHLSIKQVELSGMMLIRQTGMEEYKIAFINELGMSYLEGIVNNKNLNTHLEIRSISPFLDHRSLIRGLEESLGLLMADGISINNGKMMKSKENEGVIYKVKTGDGISLFYTDTDGTRIIKIIRLSAFFMGLKQEIMLKYSTEDAFAPSEIGITDHHSKLEMKLSLISDF